MLPVILLGAVLSINWPSGDHTVPGSVKFLKSASGYHKFTPELCLLDKQVPVAELSY